MSEGLKLKKARIHNWLPDFTQTELMKMKRCCAFAFKMLYCVHPHTHAVLRWCSLTKKTVGWGLVMWSKAEIRYGTKTISLNVVKIEWKKNTFVEEWIISRSKETSDIFAILKCFPICLFICLFAFHQVHSIMSFNEHFTAVTTSFTEPLNLVILFSFHLSRTYLGQIWQTVCII